MKRRSEDGFSYPDIDGTTSIGSGSYSGNEDGWCISLGCGGNEHYNTPRAPVISASSSIRGGSSETLFLDQTSGVRRVTRRRKGTEDQHGTNNYNLSTLIASELSKMTLEDREKVLEEVHGVVENNQEDPDEIQILFEKVQEELKRIRYKQAYEKAAFLSNTYVTDPEFVLHFLRADNYKPRKAAVRLVEHFKHKLELFGEDALVREIMYDDLTEDEKAILRTGFVQVLPDTDRAGRYVFVCNLSEFLNTGTMRDMIRATWYLSVRTTQMATNKSELGIVGVYFTHEMGNIWEKLSRDQYVNGTSFMGNALPFKFASVHFCFESNTLVAAIQSTLMMSLGRYARIRSRSHCGSRLECTYALRSYGINIDYDLQQGISHVQKWGLQQCKQLDDYFREIHDKRLLPGPKDVLLGRGRPFQLYSGNLALTVTIDQYRERYISSKKMDKKAITAEIVENIVSSGGRFLKRVNDDEASNIDWKVVDFETARLKVSHSFRTMSKEQKIQVENGGLNPQAHKGYVNGDEGSVASIPSISADDTKSLDLVVDFTPSNAPSSN